MKPMLWLIVLTFHHCEASGWTKKISPSFIIQITSELMDGLLLKFVYPSGSFILASSGNSKSGSSWMIGLEVEEVPGFREPWLSSPDEGDLGTKVGRAVLFIEESPLAAWGATGWVETVSCFNELQSAWTSSACEEVYGIRTASNTISRRAFSFFM